jgi:TupA-like ATPgrasp
MSLRVNLLKWAKKKFKGASLYGVIQILPDWHWLNQLVHHNSLHWFLHGNVPQKISDCTDLNDYWLLFKSNPKSAIFSYFVDKDLVKDFIVMVLGQSYVIPTLLVTDTVAGLKGFYAEHDFIVKPTHSSYHLLFKPAHSSLTSEDLNQCKQWFKSSIYKKTREYQYRLLKPKYIIEPRLFYQDGPPQDFKFMVVNGQVQYIAWIRDKHVKEKLQLYTPEWQRVHVKFKGYDRLHDPEDQPRPWCLTAMLEIAEKLGQLFPVVRVDLYLTDEGIKFSELTFTPSNGTQTYDPPGFLKPMWEKLPSSWPNRIL